MGTDQGVIKVRTIRRMGNMADRWDKKRLASMKGVPWEPIPGREGIAIKSRVHFREENKPEEGVEEGKEREVIRRRAKITVEDMEGMGVTPNCRGCEAYKKGQRVRLHSEVC